MEVLFEPHGPYYLPKRRRPGGWVLAHARELKEQLPEAVRGHIGVYVIAVRAGKGFTPWYVGKAVKQPFGSECFSPDKLRRMQQVLAEGKGSLVLFLCAYPKRPGPRGTKLMKHLEIELIRLAEAANPLLLNNHHKGQGYVAYGIRTVLRGGKGKPGQAAQALKRTMNL